MTKILEEVLDKLTNQSASGTVVFSFEQMKQSIEEHYALTQRGMQEASVKHVESVVKKIKDWLKFNAEVNVVV